MAGSESSLTFFELNKLVRAGIDSRLETFFTAKKQQAGTIDPKSRKLIEDIERVVRRGGKRLRPTLAVIGYQAFGGEDLELALDAALSVELLHAFTLIHDDVIDCDRVRHNGDNLGGIYYKRLAKTIHPRVADHLADAMAILGGDFVFNWVFEALADARIEGDVLRRLMRHQNGVIFETAAGEQLDVLMPFEAEPSLKRLLKIPLYKTGRYSFVGPLQFGAILAGQDASVAAFEVYGANLGIAYQIIDDDLGMFGSHRAVGKPNTTDLRENKPTILRYYAFRLANPSQKDSLSKLFGKAQAGQQDLKIARKILTENGARSKALIIAQEYGDRATAALKTDGLGDTTKSQLAELAEFCLRRKH